MRKRFIAAFLLGACPPAFATGLQPGEWQIHSTTTSPLFAAAQNSVFKYCVTREDAENPEGWMAQQSKNGECKLTPGERTADSMTWEMACPKTNMRGSGAARLTGPDTLEGEMKMTGSFQGYVVQMNTRVSAKRLGPCKN
jgi:hypothetical protein